MLSGSAALRGTRANGPNISVLARTLVTADRFSPGLNHPPATTAGGWVKIVSGPDVHGDVPGHDPAIAGAAHSPILATSGRRPRSSTMAQPSNATSAIPPPSASAPGGHS